MVAARLDWGFGKLGVINRSPGLREYRVKKFKATQEVTAGRNEKKKKRTKVHGNSSNGGSGGQVRKREKRRTMTGITVFMGAVNRSARENRPKKKTGCRNRRELHISKKSLSFKAKLKDVTVGEPTAGVKPRPLGHSHKNQFDLARCSTVIDHGP